MSRSPEARVAPEASGIGESSCSRLKSKHTLRNVPPERANRGVTNMYAPGMYRRNVPTGEYTWVEIGD
eukprot:103700-Prymnesium_polylepis.1